MHRIPNRKISLLGTLLLGFLWFGTLILGTLYLHQCLCVGGSSFFRADYRHWVKGNQPSSLNFCCTGQCFCVGACILIWFSCFIIVIQHSVLWIPVLRIHDILGWIRIRIRGCMPLTNGSGSGSFYLRHWPSRWQQKTNFFTQFFLLMSFEATFTSFFKDKSSKKVTK